METPWMLRERRRRSWSGPARQAVRRAGRGEDLDVEVVRGSDTQLDLEQPSGSTPQAARVERLQRKTASERKRLQADCRLDRMSESDGYPVASVHGCAEQIRE